MHHDALGVELAILCDVLRSNIGAAASHRNGLGGAESEVVEANMLPYVCIHM